MTRKILPVFLILTFLIGFSAQAQVEVKKKEEKEKDEILSMPIISFAIGGVLPGGEMGKIYDPFFSFGASFMYKTNKNWLWGVDADFLLGADNVKADQMRKILADIITPEGYVIGTDGTDAGVTGELQGISGIVKIGKTFPLTQKNRNTGIHLSFGAGYLQKRILFNPTLVSAPQIEGDYAKGYDCMTRGFQIREFIGYMYMSNDYRYFNFWVGFEFTQAWSKSARDYIFFEQKKDNNSYFDAMYSLKVGWMFPLKGKKAKDFYYY